MTRYIILISLLLSMLACTISAIPAAPVVRQLDAPLLVRLTNDRTLPAFAEQSVGPKGYMP